MNAPASFNKSAAGRQMAAHAKDGQLVLQQCANCNTVQYPPREVCVSCLGEQLDWQEQSQTGRVLAVSEIHHSLEDVYQDWLPWTVASIELECGPVALVRLPGGPLPPDSAVNVAAVEFDQNHWILQASPSAKEITT